MYPNLPCYLSCLPTPLLLPGPLQRLLAVPGVACISLPPRRVDLSRVLMVIRPRPGALALMICRVQQVALTPPEVNNRPHPLPPGSIVAAAASSTPAISFVELG